MWQPLNLTEVCPANSNVTACTSFGHIYLNLLMRLYGDSKDRRIQEQIMKEEEDNGITTIEKTTHHSREWDNDVYDFIVVGAGAAGCIVANRLSENKRRMVLMLEAGIEQPDVTLVPALGTSMLGSNVDWGYETERDGRTCLARSRERCNWSRGNKMDFDDWKAMGNPGWSYDEVLPYFKKSEKNLNIEYQSRIYHDVDGEQPVSLFPYEDDPSKMIIEAFHEIGLPIADYNGEDQEAAIYAQTFSKDGQRVSTNNAFIQTIRYKRTNLVVKVEAEVFKLLINENKTAYGVKYKRNDTIYTAYAKKEVILCGGPINSPKLLMLSGVGPKEHLEKLNIPVIQNLPVGENLHDHVTFDGIIIALNQSSATVDHETILHQLSKSIQGIEKKYGPLSATGSLATVAFYKIDRNLPAPDIEVQIHGVYLHGYIRNNSIEDNLLIFPTSFYDALIPRAMYLLPKSRGRLILNALNPHGAPLLYPNYLQDPSDLTALIKGFRYLLKLENIKAFKSRGAYFLKTSSHPCAQFQFATDKYYSYMAYAYTSTTYHPAGTCKMGPKFDKSAVVDPELRVYGISSLRVIDSSIMPRVVICNTQAPSMTIGEKGFDSVIRHWLHFNHSISGSGVRSYYFLHILFLSMCAFSVYYHTKMFWLAYIVLLIWVVIIL